MWCRCGWGVSRGCRLSGGWVWGGVVESVGLDTGFAAVDLELVASWSGSGVRLRLDGNADLFEVATLRRLVGSVVSVVSAGVAGAGCGGVECVGDGGAVGVFA